MTNLEANSTGLEEILAMVNALPEASGGGIEFPDAFKVSNSIAGTFTPTTEVIRIAIDGFSGITPRLAIVYTDSTDVHSSGYAFRFGFFVNNRNDPYQGSHTEKLVWNDGEFGGGYSSSCKNDGVSLRSTGKMVFPETVESYDYIIARLTESDSYSVVGKISEEDDHLFFKAASFSTSSTYNSYFLLGVTYNYIIFY